MLGGEERLPPIVEDKECFFFSKRYDKENSRFEDLLDSTQDENVPYTPCLACRRKVQKKKEKEAIYENGMIIWNKEVYKVGSGVFLDPDSFKFPTAPKVEPEIKKTEKIDESLYPEYYRKNLESIKGSNLETPNPFCIGLIEEILDSKSDLKIKVRKFYRPENTHKGMLLAYYQDLNLLYWSFEEVTLPFSKVHGKCYIAYGDGLNSSVKEWSEKGTHRFYFNQVYDPKTKTYSDTLPNEAKKIGLPGKGKGKGKSNKTENECAPDWDKVDPLNCMDVFAGCGGLSEGLHQAGIAVTKWAIEKEPAAAQAFKWNNPDALVYTDDCNEILKLVMDGEGKNRNFPKKGEVEILVGGPPCQGFSGMNRFSAGQYSLFKNSLIVSYLSYCDYYRPKYFILENVRNFVSFKRSIVLKLTLRCLLAMGYQVSFGVLQAGHYGVPQTRRRLIIFAAAPGYVLPSYPEPLHVFNKRGCQLSVQVGEFKFSTGNLKFLLIFLFL